MARRKTLLLEDQESFAPDFSEKAKNFAHTSQLSGEGRLPFPLDKRNMCILDSCANGERGAMSGARSQNCAARTLDRQVVEGAEQVAVLLPGGGVLFCRIVRAVGFLEDLFKVVDEL